MPIAKAALADSVSVDNPPVVRRRLSNVVVPAGFAALALFCAIFSPGFLEADEISHFLFARSVWHDWTAVFSIWGRLGCTGLYALAAPFGVVAARLVGVGVTLLVCVGTAMLLRQFLRRSDRSTLWTSRHAAALAWALLFAQPCFAMNSFTVMTEMLLACCWVWAAVVLMKFRASSAAVLLASLFVGIGGLMRPEGWIAIACWPIFVGVWLRAGIVRTRLATSRLLLMILAATLIAGLPPLLWYLLGVVGKQNWVWVLQQWPWSPKSVYGKRTFLFIVGAIAAMAVWMWLPILAGIRRITAGRGAWSARRKAAVLLLVTPFAAFFFMHGVLGSLGLFGSMALPRYFVCVAPMAAVLSFLGLQHAEQRMTNSGVWKMKVGIVAAVVLPLSVFAVLGIMPTRAGKSVTELNVIAEAIEARQTRGNAPPRMVIGHPYLLLRLGLPLDAGANNQEFTRESLAADPPGTLLATELQLWRNEGRPNAEEMRAWGWREDAEVAERMSKLKPVWDILMILEDPKEHSVLWVKQ
jgi:hypothetical protein